jgi:hypothetical protein
MIAIITDNGVGGTFLNWSLHYLSGHDRYYHAKTENFLQLVNNPLSKINAHVHRPNQPLSIEDFDIILPKLLLCQTNEFQSIYFHWLMPLNSALENTKIAIKNTLTHASKTVVLSLPKEMTLYQCSYKSRANATSSMSDNNRLITDDTSRWQDYIDYFFLDSKEKWNSLNLHNVWDQREFLALNLRPFEYKTIANLFEHTDNYYQINSVNLWNTFDTNINSLFEYLEINIDSDRYKKWISVYSEWRRIHQDRMLFCWYFKIIINNIIKGHDMDLGRFNLDIVQEAAIQHYLIYKHNLNFKTWQLEKFINTKQLHNLLEPNIHPLAENNTIKI